MSTLVEGDCTECGARTLFVVIDRGFEDGPELVCVVCEDRWVARWAETETGAD